MRTLTLLSRHAPLASTDEQRRRLAAVAIAREFPDALAAADHWPLTPAAIATLQINVGRLCNQTCRHCHVDAGPDRREVMSRETMTWCLRALDANPSLAIVDVTGGAPELNPDFRWLVDEVVARGRHVMDRCNLTILTTPGQRDLPEFFAARRVEVVASLPHYRALNTDAQRGEGVYEKSIEALKRLNAVGYGDGRSGLRLVLVTNPVGAFLPPAQRSLEAEWKRELMRLHGVTFDALFCLTNMPISRYLEWLLDAGQLDAYLQRLVAAFNPDTAPGVMCRSLVSVGWDGRLYDCDFNQMLDLEIEGPAPRHIRDFDLASLTARAVRVGRHCFGCTAGAGSSCGGSIK
ncbi:MAG TPA: arsenosugar biosynthesis radical SAM (seleno)protein ArsS [Vicinamibacterales bacterium]|nr:arsenosugar biosynthesis radical SAM (seleno)protein ArsS [Vicinamibacterales bacterium]